MVNPVGNTVSRLIRERSYTGGEIKVLEQKLAQAAAVLKDAGAAHRKLRRELRVATLRLAVLDAEIAEKSTVRLSEICARRAVPKRFSTRHGSAVGELVRLLKTAGRPLATHELVTPMVDKFGLPVATTAERRYARKWVTCKLQALAHKGAVVRLHDLMDNLQGLWLWNGVDSHAMPATPETAAQPSACSRGNSSPSPQITQN
jgi:hypothetical protein